MNDANEERKSSGKLFCFRWSSPEHDLNTFGSSCTVTGMDHIEWLTQTTRSDSEREIGRHSGVAFRTINSQVKRGRLSAEVVINVAQGYGKSPVRALVDTDFIDEQWVEGIDPEAALRSVSEDDLADEVLRRMKLAGDHTTLDTPVDELAARRSNTQGEDDTPAVQSDWDDMPEDAVADSSPEEGGTPDDYEP